MTVYRYEQATPELPEPGQYWVAPTAVLLGRVRLEVDASVWFGAVLRGDNELITVGRGSNVQDGCVLHTDMGFPLTIGPGCTIGHLAMLHGCTIAANSLIGIGATVLNGARIGEFCIIGAHTFIPEGKEIPDGSLVMGTPGKVVRTLGEKEREGLFKSAQGYADRWKVYDTSLTPIESG